MKKELKFTVGQKVDYILAGKVLFSGTIVKAESKRGLKPYTIKTADGKTKYANEEVIFLTPERENYKGYEIRTTPNGDGHISLIYKDGEFKGGTASDLCGDNAKNSIEKARVKIDSYGK